MENLGVFNGAHGADQFGFRNLKRVYWNLEAPALYEQSLARRESQLAQGGAILADTGIHTGRSPKDKFVVRDEATADKVWWDNNASISREQFDLLLEDFLAHAEGKELFAQDLYGGADPAHRVKARVFSEYAWHSLFIRNLLIRPERSDLAGYAPDLTIVDLPSFRADPARHGARSETVIACDFTRKIVLIGATSYAGEMKKSVFTYLNYAAAEAERAADALLGQRGGQGRRGRVLRPVGHGQDDALERSQPDPPRRRRARLGPERGVQLRGRLLRQDDPPVARGRARDLRHHRALRHRARERRHRSRHARAGFRRRLENRERALRLSDRLHPEGEPDRPGRASEEHRDAHRRRLRGHAPDRQAHRRRRRCTTSSPATPPRSPAPRRA